ncbi:hypothetical protein MTR67_050949 [Solanum verrucosum]|uniref:TF-B3 domain-containing protein n=1 Tax=Solanum verrucosum TaxID=315347 RepID=A0AAF0V5C2_SOLVR|nr:hypothetical protein MTR67_050949 [Solanum verrucosum]
MENERNLISSTTTYLMIDDCDSSSSPKKQKIHAREQASCIFGSKLKGVAGEHSGYCGKDDADAEFSYKKHFEKKLTLSDVGKHNRLLIPKRYATKYFSQVQDEEMVFYDTSRTLWKFRYCYIKKSQTFIFSKGWRKFVKDNNLRAKDTIVFNLCEFKNGTKENCNTFVIDVVKNIEVLPMDLALNHHHQVETNEFMRAQPFDHNVVALIPVCLFGKQIGWTETKKEMEFN